VSFGITIGKILNTSSVLIVGGYGETGRRIADYLLKHSDLNLIIAGRNFSKAEEYTTRFNNRFDSPRCKALCLDVIQTDDLKNALKNVRFLVNAGPALDSEVLYRMADLCIENSVDWIDVQFDPSQYATLEKLDSKMRDNDCCFVSQGGFHPGLPGAMVRWASGEFDQVFEAEIGGLLRQKNGLPYTSGVDELIELFRDYKAHIYEDHKWREANYSKKDDMPLIDFPFGFGPRRCFPMDLEEILLIPEIVPSLRKVAFYIGGFNNFSDFIVTPLIMAGLKLLPKVRVSFWGKMLSWSTKFGRAPYGTSVHLKATGYKDGLPASAQLSLFHNDGYDFTAIPVAATLLQIYDGTCRKAGLFRMAHIVEPERLIVDLENMGVKVQRIFSKDE